MGVLIAAAMSALVSIAFPGLSGAFTGDNYGYDCGNGQYGYSYEYCGPTTGHLIVIKHVVKDNGGTAVASNFTMTINGVTATGGNSFAGAESPGADKEVTPGNYSVSETGPSGYAASYSADCTGKIDAGQTKTCTVTNDDIPAHLIVIKHVVNTLGGKVKASQFSMKINGITVVGTNPFPGAESPGTNKTVGPGTYTVTETGPAGFLPTSTVGCSGTIALGETKTCTIVNHDLGSYGYWKNHRQQTTALLPKSIGSYSVDTWAKASAVFNKTSCSNSSAQNAVGCLAGQLLAAELNLANGGSTCIQPTVTKASTFLSSGSVTVSGTTATGIAYVGPTGTYNLTSAQRTIAVKLASALEAYNTGASCANP